MIIANYGLFWKRDAVYWGERGRNNAGTLMGRLSRLRRSPPVNFRNQAGIYILQDGFRVIYIGQTGRGNQRLFNRLRQHKFDHLAERWDRFSWFGTIPVERADLAQDPRDGRVHTAVETILNHIEGVLISVTEPPLNRQGARFGEADQYSQVNQADIEALIDDEEQED